MTAPSGFEVATDGTNYGSSKTVTPSAGSVNATISVRLATTATAGAQSGNVTVTSANSEVSTKNVSVSGNVTAASLPAIALVPTSASGLTNYFKYPSASTNYTVTGTNLGTTNLTVTPSSSSLEVSTNATTDFTNSLTFTPVGGVVSNTVYVRVSAAAPAGAVNETVANVSSSASNNFTVTGTVTTPPLTITMVSSLFEGDSSQTGTISIPADLVLASDLTVTLGSNSGTDLQVDGGAGLGALTTVTISAGTTSATFFLNAPADNTIDADASVTLTATADNFATATKAVTVKNADVAKASFASIGTAYTQNFDLLGTGNIANAIPTTIGSQANLGTLIGSGLTGWFATKLSGTSASGGFTAITADTGGSTSGFIYSYGASGNTDRALGALASGSNVMGFGAVFQNDTGSTINSVSLSFTSEFWRSAGSNKNKFTFAYGKLGGSVTGVNFLTASGATLWKSADVDGPLVATPQGALDGNLTANQKAVSTSFNITLAPGESLYIRWQDADEAGSDGGAGIDNFSITASTEAAVQSPPTVSDVSLEQLTLTQTAATVISEVTGDGGVGVDTIGFVYSVASVNADPVVGGASVSNVTNNTPAVGLYTNALSGLTAGTSYAVKAYAVNTQGTNYSAVATVTTLAANPSFTGVYTQSFAGVTNFGLIPAGWRALSSSNQNNFVGSWTNASAATGGFYSRTNTPGILGYLHTSSTGILTNKLTLVNGTGSALTNLYVSYTGEVSITNNPRIPAFTVAVNGVTVPELAYDTAGGTNAAISTQLTGLNIANGDLIVITWSCDRGTNTGSSRMIGLTDVRVGTTAPGPSAPSNLSYSPSTINGFVGQAISSLTPTVTGTVDTYSVNPALPTGLSINPSSGVISGVPQVTASSTYTVTAANAGGATTTGVTIQVSKGTPIIVVPPTAPALTVGASLSSSTLTGGSASVAGTFAWTDGTIVPSATGSYGVTFTPTDTANYNTATTTVNVTLVHFLESALGDFSGAAGSPTTLNLGTASKSLLGSVTGGTDSADYLTFTVPGGYRLDAVWLRSYQSTDNVAFMAIDEGAIWSAAQDTSAMLGYSHFGGSGDVGTDLLTKMNVAGSSLAAGTYTVWIQQLGAATIYGLEFELTALPTGSTFAGWSSGGTLNAINLTKYAIGGASSLTASDGVTPNLALGGSDLVLTAIVRTDDPKLTVEAEAVANLTDYATPSSVTTLAGLDAADQTNVPAGCTRRIFSVAQGPGTKKFLRLKATLQP